MRASSQRDILGFVFVSSALKVWGEHKLFFSSWGPKICATSQSSQVVLRPVFFKSGFNIKLLFIFFHANFKLYCQDAIRIINTKPKHRDDSDNYVKPIMVKIIVIGSYSP